MNNDQLKLIKEKWAQFPSYAKWFLVLAPIFLIAFIGEQLNAKKTKPSSTEQTCNTSYAEAKHIAELRVSGKGILQDGFTSNAFGKPVYLFLCVMHGSQYCNIMISSCGEVTAVKCGGVEIVNSYEEAKSIN